MHAPGKPVTGANDNTMLDVFRDQEFPFNDQLLLDLMLLNEHITPANARHVRDALHQITDTAFQMGREAPLAKQNDVHRLANRQDIFDELDIPYDADLHGALLSLYPYYASCNPEEVRDRLLEIVRKTLDLEERTRSSKMQTANNSCENFHEENLRAEITRCMSPVHLKQGAHALDLLLKYTYERGVDDGRTERKAKPKG